MISEEISAMQKGRTSRSRTRKIRSSRVPHSNSTLAIMPLVRPQRPREDGAHKQLLERRSRGGVDAEQVGAARFELVGVRRGGEQRGIVVARGDLAQQVRERSAEEGVAQREDLVREDSDGPRVLTMKGGHT